MRKVLTAALAVMLVVSLAGLAQAQDQIQAAGERLADGTKDAALGWTEVPKQMYETGKENPALGVTTAPIQGAKDTALRTTEGALEAGLFVFPESDEPHARREAGRSVSERLVGGLADTVTGAAELPKEMYEEGKKNPLRGATIGVVRGAEKTTLKTTEGVLEVGTFPFPETATSHPE